MRAEAQPTGQQMMLSTNLWSCAFLGMALTITGEGVTFCDFVTRHPFTLVNLTLLSAASAIGQLFIYVTVSIHMQVKSRIIEYGKNIVSIKKMLFCR